MVWLPWQCALGRWVSGSASSPASPQWRATGCAWTGARGLPTPTSHCWATHGPVWRAAWARHLGTRTVTSRCQSFLSICSMSIYISQRPETALALFSFLCYSPTVERRRVRKWKVGHRFCFCHLAPRPCRSRAISVIIIWLAVALHPTFTSSQRPHLWLRARESQMLQSDLS